jgi:hypothetical protein
LPEFQDVETHRGRMTDRGRRNWGIGAAVLCVLAAGCGGGSHEASACAGAGFVGGAERADGIFAARIPPGCATPARRTCTVADGEGPIDREVVPAGAANGCFAFNGFVGSGLPMVPGSASGECFGRALLHAPGAPTVEHPLSRCDGGRSPSANAGTRVPPAPPVPGSAGPDARAPDPYGVGPNAGGVGDAAHPATAPPWSVLVWRARDGTTCFEPGQYVDRHTPGRSDELPGVPARGRLRRGRMVGLLRYDARAAAGIQLYGVGRFTEYDTRIGGSCGDPAAGAGLLMSWERRFARPDASYAFTIVSGIAGPRVRSVAVGGAGGWRPLELGRRRAFLDVVRGPRRPALRVTYADGSARTFA